MTDLPTHHGICPYCASAVSCVTRDGMTYARCSHRGCGARGPYHRDLIRAVEWFTGKPHPAKAPAQDGELRRVDGAWFTAAPGPESPIPRMTLMDDEAPAQDGAERCEVCEGTGSVHARSCDGYCQGFCPQRCSACNGTERKGER